MMSRFFRSLFVSEEGATMAEYAIMLALLGAALITSVSALSNAVWHQVHVGLEHPERKLITDRQTLVASNPAFALPKGLPSGKRKIAGVASFNRNRKNSLRLWKQARLQG